MLSKEQRNQKIDESKQWLKSLFEDDTLKGMTGGELRLQILQVIVMISRDLELLFDYVASAVIKYAEQFNSYTAKEFQHFKL